jgi:hypothetical protein
MVTSVSLLNLTYGWGELNLWTLLLTSSLGYIMPNPKIKFLKENVENSINTAKEANELKNVL